MPLARAAFDLLTGRIHGEWIKEITHRTGFWGLILITATLAITPLRRITGFNQLQSFRRMFGLFGFFYICVHFLVIYVVLDKQVPFDPAFAWHEILKDIVKRPYITVGFIGFVLMIPLALTSTKASIKRLGKKWIPLHSLIYVTAMAGVIHFMWSVKADRLRPTDHSSVLQPRTTHCCRSLDTSCSRRTPVAVTVRDRHSRAQTCATSATAISATSCRASTR